VFFSETPLELWAIFHWNRKWIEFVFAGGLRVSLLLTLSSSLGCRCLHWKQLTIERKADALPAATETIFWKLDQVIDLFASSCPKSSESAVCCLSFGFSCCSAQGKTPVKEQLLWSCSGILFECNYWWWSGGLWSFQMVTGKSGKIYCGKLISTISCLSCKCYFVCNFKIFSWLLQEFFSILGPNARLNSNKILALHFLKNITTVFHHVSWPHLKILIGVR